MIVENIATSMNKSCSAGSITLNCQMPNWRFLRWIHARLGAYFAEYEYGITDSEILDAITYHTTGRPAMTMIEKIVYLADYIEPGRKKIPGLAEVRTAAFDDIDTAVCMDSRINSGILKKSRKKSRSYDRKTCQYIKIKPQYPCKGISDNPERRTNYGTVKTYGTSCLSGTGR